MNTEMLKGKFTEFAGEVKRLWGKVTNDEIIETKGNLMSIAGIIEQKYGMKKDAVMAKLEELKARFEFSADQANDKVKTFLASKSEDVKKTLR